MSATKGESFTHNGRLAAAWRAARVTSAAMLRVQTERQHEASISANDYIHGYQLNAERLKRAKPDSLVLHPGPMNRGIEIAPEVADGPQSCVLDQVTNGVAVRMAILYLLVVGEQGTHPASPAPVEHNRRATDRSSPSSASPVPVPQKRNS